MNGPVHNKPVAIEYYLSSTVFSNVDAGTAKGIAGASLAVGHLAARLVDSCRMEGLGGREGSEGGRELAALQGTGV